MARVFRFNVHEITFRVHVFRVECRGILRAVWNTKAKNFAKYYTLEKKHEKVKRRQVKDIFSREITFIYDTRAYNYFERKFTL